MKKALQISIAQTLFTVEEDAYAALEAYLASVKAHFSGTVGADEINADIESRIAELLVESKERVVTLPTVERILAEMGKVEDFDGAQEAPPSDKTEESSTKKLYRNTDDAIIAGVCSGLAAYFGVDVLWVRIAAVVLSFFNGLGILAYLVLWLLVPPAKTGAQKLQMQGQPVTLETLTEAVNERIGELKMKERSGLRKLIAVPFMLLGKFIAALLRVFGPLVRVGVGLFLVLITLPALVGIGLGAGFLFSGDMLLLEGLSLQSLLPGVLHWLVPLAILGAALIPVLFVLFAGISILKRTAVVPSTVALGLFGIWIVALVGCGVGAAKIAAGYEAYTKSAPSYKEASTTIPLEGPFESLSVRGMHLHIEASTSTRLVATGRERDMAMIGAHVENGVLTIERQPVEESDEFCLFCDSSQPELVLYTDSLGNISAEDSYIESDEFPAQNAVEISLAEDSYADFSVALQALTASLTNDSGLTLRGSVDSLTTSLSNRSRLDAADAAVKDSHLTLERDSSAEINASRSLSVTAHRDSYVRSYGSTTTTKDIDESSTLFTE